MISIPGYRIKKTLSKSKHYAVYQADKTDAHLEVIIKATQNQFPSAQEIASLEQELKLSSLISNNQIIRPISLQRHKSVYYLVTESFGGVTLKEHLKNQPLKLESFF